MGMKQLHAKQEQTVPNRLNVWASTALLAGTLACSVGCSTELPQKLPARQATISQGPDRSSETPFVVRQCTEEKKKPSDSLDAVNVAGKIAFILCVLAPLMIGAVIIKKHDDEAREEREKWEKMVRDNKIRG